MYIICDEFGIIKNVSDKCLIILGYAFGELNDKFIGMIMSPYMSFLHKNYLLPMYRSMTQEQKTTSHVFLSSSMSIRNRPLIIYTKTHDPLCVHLSVDHYTSEMEGLFRMIILSVEKLDSSLIYTSDLHPPETSLFTESSIDMMVLCLDMKDSTKYLTEYGTTKMIDMHKLFHSNLVELIRNEFYPYLYIHEIMGDGFCLVMNIEWGYSFPRFCASMVYSFLTKLYQQTNHLIPFRAGVGYGKLHYGYIDHHLRFFGETIHRASRYEHQSKTFSFCCDAVFYEKLLSEGMFSNVNHENENVDLKGLGSTEVYHIHYTFDYSPRMKEPFRQATQSLSLTGTPIMTRTPSPEVKRSIKITETSASPTFRLRPFPTTVQRPKTDVSIFFDSEDI